MILVRDEIEAKNIVHSAQVNGPRSTTYDATVGEIIIEGKSIQESSFTLLPRGIAWVISTEEFRLPSDVTGLATLKTTWTHNGVLALNLGIVDPG
jgi:deoxycytidine triphosphate deaminase